MLKNKNTNIHFKTNIYYRVPKTQNKTNYKLLNAVNGLNPGVIDHIAVKYDPLGECSPEN